MKKPLRLDSIEFSKRRALGPLIAACDEVATFTWRAVAMSGGGSCVVNGRILFGPERTRRSLFLVLPGGSVQPLHVSLSQSVLPWKAIRWWWLCPGCGGRRRHLFVANRSLGCRTCLGLIYEAQAKSRDVFDEYMRCALALRTLSGRSHRAKRQKKDRLESRQLRLMRRFEALQRAIDLGIYRRKGGHFHVNLKPLPFPIEERPKGQVSEK